MNEADIEYLRNINTRPGPSAGHSINPTKPGPDDVLPREHQDPSKWPTREIMERAHAAQSDAESVAWTRERISEVLHTEASKRQVTHLGLSETADILVAVGYTAPPRCDASAKDVATKIASRPALAKLIDTGALQFSEMCDLRDDIEKALRSRPDASAEIAELQERCADAQRLAFEWMERHDRVVGFISKNHPAVMIPNLPFPSPVSRPDTSAGLIEAAGRLVDRVEGPFGWATATNAIGERLKDQSEWVAFYLAARAADRSEK